VPAGRERTVSYSTGQPLIKEICTYYHALFLTAVRAGLCRGKLVALQWGDLQLGGDDTDSDRFIWCGTTTCGANTLLRRARDPGGWICLANSAGYLSSFETNVCWRA
jgi:hypothetical protein